MNFILFYETEDRLSKLTETLFPSDFNNICQENEFSYANKCKTIKVMLSTYHIQIGLNYVKVNIRELKHIRF